MTPENKILIEQISSEILNENTFRVILKKKKNRYGGQVCVAQFLKEGVWVDNGRTYINEMCRKNLGFKYTSCLAARVSETVLESDKTRKIWEETV